MSDRSISNREIADALREIALFLDMEGVQFKPRAYEKAAQAIDDHARPLQPLWRELGMKAVGDIPGVGKSIAQKVDELLRTGSIDALQKMREATPVDIAALTQVDGVGPKTVRALWHELGVQSVDDLRKAAESGRLAGIPHFGKKTEERILRGISFLSQGAGRVPIADALAYVRPIEHRLRDLSFVEQCVIAGSIRRFRETIGDVDFLVVSTDADRVIDFFTTMNEVTAVHAKGANTKASVRLANGMDADLRVVPAESFGAAMCYFTGSKAHNVHMRKLAIGKGWKLNEYGLFTVEDERRVAGRTEEEIFEALGLDFVAPELREDAGEIEAARDHRLPDLIRPGSLRGDLQIQTTWTDGKDSIEEMVATARRMGLEYIAITDHTRDLAMTGGSDEAKLREQMAYIRQLREKVEGVRILCGAEVNIRKDGTLDIADEVLAELDFVGAAIHHHFTLPRDEQTRRVLRALENPHVDVWFHPTARKLGERPPVDLDIDACIAAAVRTGTVLEIDAHGHRMDLRDEHIRAALAAGGRLCIDSDAHRASEMAYPEMFGIPLARRGWATAADVVNTLPLDRFLASLKRGRRSE
jgi:DNA polymerase (family 10)